MRINLVLGAGGAAGWVFHAGVLRTLLNDAGWDAHAADLIVGTSAGAAVAAGVRAGSDPDHIVASVTQGPSEADRAAYREVMESRKRTFRPLSPGLVRHVLPGGQGVGVAAAGLLPAGWFPTDPLGRFPGVNGHDTWPNGLWITAMRARDGELVVFGRDRSDILVHEAVEASSAVPGMFQPKEIDGERYLDGGLVSPTHADLAVAGRPDLVIVSSPMTRPSRRALPILAKWRLGPELRELERSRVATYVIAPDGDGDELFRGFPRRNPERAHAIVELASAQTRAVLQSGLGKRLPAS